MKRSLLVLMVLTVTATVMGNANDEVMVEVRNSAGTKVNISLAQLKIDYVKTTISSDQVKAEQIILNDDGSVTLRKPRHNGKTINSPLTLVDLVCLNVRTLGATGDTTLIEREEGVEGEVTLLKKSKMEYQFQTGALKSITCRNLWSAPPSSGLVLGVDGPYIKVIEMTRALKGRLGTKAQLESNTESFEKLADGTVKLVNPFVRYNGTKLPLHASTFIPNLHLSNIDPICRFFGFDEYDHTKELKFQADPQVVALLNDAGNIDDIATHTQSSPANFGPVAEITCKDLPN